MVIKKIILQKTLSNGITAQVALVRNSDGYSAMLLYGGKQVPGPSEPQRMNPPKGEVTHWIGGKPSVGLTATEAEKIFSVLATERSTLGYQ